MSPSYQIKKGVIFIVPIYLGLNFAGFMNNYKQINAINVSDIVRRENDQDR